MSNAGSLHPACIAQQSSGLAVFPLAILAMAAHWLLHRPTAGPWADCESQAQCDGRQMAWGPVECDPQYVSQESGDVFPGHCRHARDETRRIRQHKHSTSTSTLTRMRMTRRDPGQPPALPGPLPASWRSPRRRKRWLRAGPNDMRPRHTAPPNRRLPWAKWRRRRHT